MNKLSQFAIIAFTTAVLVFQFNFSEAQTSKTRNKENFEIKRFQVRKVSMPSPVEKIKITGASSIIVIDARADTGRIGLMQKLISKNLNLDPEKIQKDEQLIRSKPTFVKINGGLQNEVALFANKYFQFSDKDSLISVLMVIKKLWLSDELNIDEAVTGDKKMLTTERREIWTSGIDAKIEFYIRDRENYYPFYRFDSVISKPLTVSEYGVDYLTIALSSSFGKLALLDDKIKKGFADRRAFSIQEIQEHNANQWLMPALKDTILKRGVYFSFNEFKNNAPSVLDYSIKKEKMTDVLYVKGVDGKESPIRNVWGYCDGKGAFIKSGDNYFLLQQLENAFYIFGAKSLRWMDAQYAPAPIIGGVGIGTIKFREAGYVVDLRPYQLDWATGLLY